MTLRVARAKINGKFVASFMTQIVFIGEMAEGTVLGTNEGTRQYDVQMLNCKRTPFREPLEWAYPRKGLSN